MSPIRSLTLACLLALPALHGCSRSGSEDAAAPVAAAESEPVASPKAPAKACELVTGPEMSTILGGIVQAAADDGSNGRTGCIYTAVEGVSPYAELSVTWGDGEAAMTAMGMMGKAEDGVTSAFEGIGDQAFAVGPVLNIRVGEDLMTITLSGVDDVPAASRKIFETAKTRL